MVFVLTICFWFLFLLIVLFFQSLGITAEFTEYYISEQTINYSIIIGTAVFIIQMILIFLAEFIGRFSQKCLLLSLISIGLGIFGHILFYIVSPDYSYLNLPNFFYFSNFDNSYVTNVEDYKYYYKKFHSLNYGAFSKAFKLESAKDHVDMLNFAIELNDEVLYRRTFFSGLSFGLDKIFKEYNDRTFELYFLQIATRNVYNMAGSFVENQSHFGNYISDEDAMLLENSPYLNRISYLADNSQYPDVKKFSEYIKEKANYFNKYKNDELFKNKLENDYGPRGWHQYWDDVDNFRDDFFDGIQGLRHNFHDYASNYTSLKEYIDGK